MLVVRARLPWMISALVACSDGGSPAAEGSSSSGGGTTAATTSSSTTGVDTSSGSVDTSGAESSSTGEPGDPPELAPLCPDGFPLDFDRPDEGDPLDATELADATSRYLELLESVRWLDLVDERVHGWPQSDPEGRYWYGTWWSGVTLVKQGGAITYAHADHGADNNGLRTGPVLEGVCYASTLWPSPERELLARRMIRGFNAWIRAMQREVDDPDAPLLCRAFYPESIDVDEAGRQFHIDYDLNRPGVDGDPSEYVHVAANPDWGDVWIKNKRSKDDIGHMLRAIAQLGSCTGAFADPDTLADFEELRTTYSAWSRKVEDDSWGIATLDKDAQLWLPDDLLAHFLPAECASRLAIRLLGHLDSGDLDCGNGIGPLDDVIIASNDQNGAILRSFHEAAANNALLAGDLELAQALLEGMTIRIEQGLDGLEGLADPVPYLDDQAMFDMLAHGAAAGIPLTSREIRWMHARVEDAIASYANPDLQGALHVFDAATPDGDYVYEPYGTSIHFVGLGALLGTCASPCLNPNGRAALDCDMIAAYSP
jgi:hypothetical protein